MRAEEVIVNTDSELLVRQLNKEYKVKDVGLKFLYEQVLHLLSGFNRYEIRHIKRSENKGADRLAGKAIPRELFF